MRLLFSPTATFRRVVALVTAGNANLRTWVCLSQPHGHLTKRTRALSALVETDAQRLPFSYLADEAFSQSSARECGETLAGICRWSNSACAEPSSVVRPFEPAAVDGARIAISCRELRRRIDVQPNFAVLSCTL